MDKFKKTCLDFLRSALDNKSILDVVEWIAHQKEMVDVSLKKVPLKKLSKWYFDGEQGSIRHETGRFFSIDGIRVNATIGAKKTWDQPIINQPEVGFLGFIVKEIDGVLNFLVQAKIEPGNVNFVQLSPTLQATRSNYQQTHGGKKPLYLEYFQNATKDQILLDQLQSEQGARFLKKRNRNIIIKVEENIPQHDNFVWLTLGQLKSLMQLDNIVNMDSRTVISGIPYGDFDKESIELFQFASQCSQPEDAFLRSALIKDGAVNSIEDIITFLTEIKSTNDLTIEKIPLNVMQEWQITDYEIIRNDECFFKIIGVDVEIGNREVIKWSQPMVEPTQEGLCAFVCKEFDGILHFAVQAKMECGNFDIIELAPTVQTLTGEYHKTPKATLPFLDYVLNASPEQIYFDSIQSEEGGRFYKEQNRNCIIISGDEIDNTLPEGFIWMTLNQLYVFIKFNNYLNIQARNLIATIALNGKQNDES